MAADQFTDVPEPNVFHDDIAWLADADVTRGCNPPDNTRCCPGDNVTRQQMAAFMNRLANNQVVHAATAIEADSATSADSINGITVDRFFHQAPPNTTDQEIGNYGPVTLYASCDGAGEPELRASWNETVNHLTFNGATAALFGNATVNAGHTIGTQQAATATDFLHRRGEEAVARGMARQVAEMLTGGDRYTVERSIRAGTGSQRNFHTAAATPRTVHSATIAR